MSLRGCVLVLTLAAAFPALAADPFYLGTWKIESASRAPWFDEKQDSDLSEVRALTGKTIVIAPAGITGPRQLACRGPHYKLRNYGADMLFQGAFGEMHARDKNADPIKIAESLGFRGMVWKTLETGCANELDYHFIDLNMAAFGLNSHVYILRKQP